MEIKDFIIRYGFVAGKRYTKNQKIRFLMGITEDFESLGFQTEAKQTVDRRTPNMNLYIGNLSQARLLLETYYDTPPGCLNLFPYRYFHEGNRKGAWTISMLFPMSIIILMGILYFAGAAGNLAQKTIIQNVGTGVVLLLLLLLMHTFRRGYGRKRNIIRNTSSLYALYHFAENRKACKKTAFILTDNGCGSNLGASVCKERCKPGQIMVHLDCVGANGILYMVYDGRKQGQKQTDWLMEACGVSGIQPLDVQKYSCFSRDFFDPEDIYLIVGEMGDSGIVLGQKQLKTAEFSLENLEKVSLFLTSINKNFN